MCKNAGFEGKFTNHSLRATCATRMYDNDVPKQIIKEVTGHKSECVCTYKRTSDQLRETASHTVSKTGECSEAGKGQDNEFCTSKMQKVEEVVVKQEGNLLMEQMVANVNKTKLEIRRKKYLKAKARLRLSRFRQQKKVTIDLNVNIKK